MTWAETKSQTLNGMSHTGAPEISLLAWAISPSSLESRVLQSVSLYSSSVRCSPLSVFFTLPWIDGKKKPWIPGCDQWMVKTDYTVSDLLVYFIERQFSTLDSALRNLEVDHLFHHCIIFFAIPSFFYFHVIFTLLKYSLELLMNKHK